jgi:hypothetical protein
MRQDTTEPSRELFGMMASLPPQLHTLAEREDGRQLIESLTGQLRGLIERTFDQIGVRPTSIPRSPYYDQWAAQLPHDEVTAGLADQFTTFVRDPHPSIDDSQTHIARSRDVGGAFDRAATELRGILAEHHVIGRATATAQVYATAGQGQRSH